MFPLNPDGSVRYSEVDYIDTWKEMEKCVQLGLVKSIGVSNFNSQQLERLLKSCTIKPVVNQVCYKCCLFKQFFLKCNIFFKLFILVVVSG